MAVSRRLRFEILRRDGSMCRYCGAVAGEGPLTVDHVIPVALGGTNEPTNLVTACKDCNSGKSSISPDAPLVEDVRNDALRWARARQIAATMVDVDTTYLLDVVDEVVRHWEAWEKAKSSWGYVQHPDDWIDSIHNFLRRGVSAEAMRHFIDVAMRSKKLAFQDVWPYFCGCCWKTIKQIDDQAQHLLDTGSA